MFEVANRVPEMLMSFAVVLIVVVVGSIMIDGFDDHLNADNTTTNETLTVSAKFKTRFLGAWDLFSVTMVLIFFGGSIWLAYRMPANPVMLWGGLLYLVVVVFIAMIISNVYDGFLNGNITFANKVAEMTFFPIIMNYLVIIAIIYIVTITSVLMLGTGGGGGISE